MKQFKQRTLVLLLTCTLLFAAACSGQAPAQSPTPAITLTPVATPTAVPTATPEPAATEEELANRVAQALFDGEYDLITGMLAAAPLEQINSMGGMATFMVSLVMQTGQFVSLGGDAAFYMENGGNRFYTAPLTTEKGKYTIQIGFDAEGKIAGLSVLLAAEEPIVMPEDFEELTVTVDAGNGYPLEGRLVVPKDAGAPAPIVVLSHGSGALDYDETVGVNRIFGQIARGLAERGIASLRYTKRTYTYPEVAQEKGYSIQAEYVEDVIAAVALAREEARVDAERVYLLGHSEGGMLAPYIVEQGADVAGMILMAGTPRSLMDILEDQQQAMINLWEAMGLQQQIDEYKTQQEGWRAEREALAGYSAEEALEAAPVYGFPAYYMYVLEQVDNLGLIQSLQLPTLILQGEKDWQVFRDKDYALYEEALADEEYATLKLYEGLSHLLTPSSAEDIMTAMSEYNAYASIPAQVFDDIAEWIVSVS